MTRTRVLTGITTSGTPHLGNYAGAIRPAIQSGDEAGNEAFFFLADYHALIKAQDPERVQRSTLEIAASWLACGLDPGKVWFYRQSDIPEIPELTWFLTCVAGKGMLNRAHAYKAANDRNRELGEDDDAGVTAGLFMYPVLMAADILIFDAEKVPVGRDQIQHIEMARDIGQRFNHAYQGEYFAMPEALIDEQVSTLPGLDGRKMSKSYNNTIPLFCSRADLKKHISGILTDSRLPGEPKDIAGNSIHELYAAFATPDESVEFAKALQDGLGWGEAKAQLFAKLDSIIAPMRERYEALIANPAHIEQILLDNARRLRATYATPKLLQLRQAIGIRPLTLAADTTTAKAALKAEAIPLIKQYREKTGEFHFKISDGDSELLVSRGFAQGRDAGAVISGLKQGELSAAQLAEYAQDTVDHDVLQDAIDRIVKAELDKNA